jgi:hypothetical protein
LTGKDGDPTTRSSTAMPCSAGHAKVNAVPYVNVSPLTREHCTRRARAHPPSPHGRTRVRTFIATNISALSS